MGEIRKDDTIGEPPKFFYKFKDYEYKNTCKDRVLSGIRELDYLTSGFEMGCITIWTGLTNVGKTTVLTMLAKQTILQGNKVFFFNGEQTKDDFKNNLYKQSVDKSDIYEIQYKESCVFDSFVNAKRVMELDRLYGDNLIIYNNEMPRDIGTLLYAMEECRRLYGVKVFILDNFMQIDIQSDNVFQEQTVIMEKLRTFAVNKGIHIHLVAHPRKIDRYTNRLTLYDIAGSMNLANKAYNIISIMRVDTMDKSSNEYRKLALDMLDGFFDIEQTSTALEVIKTKGKSCGLVGLQFDKVTRGFLPQPQIAGEIRDRLRLQYGGNAKGGSPFG